MTVINAMKPLLSSSSLFFPQDGQDTEKKHGVKKKRRAQLKNMVKMGTGGTLDPLADGVLGELAWFHVLRQHVVIVGFSHWNRKGDEGVAELS